MVWINGINTKNGLNVTKMKHELNIGSHYIQFSQSQTCCNLIF